MRLRIATPAYGAMDPRSAHSFASTMSALVASGHSVTWDLEMFDPNQARARNVLLHRFLESDDERLVCIDQDSVFTPEDVLALMAIDEDVVSASYRQKADGAPGVGWPAIDEKWRGVLCSMDRIGFGLVAISRHCAETVSQARRAFVAKTGDSAGKTVPVVFHNDVQDDEWVSPDFVFSERWRAHGGLLWRHTGVSIGHAGAHVFR